MDRSPRIRALWWFATTMTLLTLLGHTVFGFEPSWVQPLVGLVAAYATEVLLETARARSKRRAPRFSGGGFKGVTLFLLPAHISGLVISMLLYTDGRLMPVAFATGAAIASKHIFRVPVARDSRHFMNPSSFGLSLALLLFPTLGIVPSYMLSESLHGLGDWVLPVILLGIGSFLSARFTERTPLILAWLGGFAAQAVARSLVFGTPPVAGLLPMSGAVFLLFTFFLLSDPHTTPSSVRGQVSFGLSVAGVYAFLMLNHLGFGLLLAHCAVCAARGLALWAGHRLGEQVGRRLRLPVVPATALGESALREGSEP